MNEFEKGLFSEPYVHYTSFNEGYNKAIDDVIKMTKGIEFRRGCIQSSLPFYEYFEIKAEQLKAGGTE